jgi:hypothetical protein
MRFSLSTATAVQYYRWCLLPLFFLCALPALQAHAFFPPPLRDLAPFLPFPSLSTICPHYLPHQVGSRAQLVLPAPTLPTLFSLFIRKADPSIQYFHLYVVVVIFSFLLPSHLNAIRVCMS